MNTFAQLVLASLLVSYVLSYSPYNTDEDSNPAEDGNILEYTWVFTVFKASEITADPSRHPPECTIETVDGKYGNDPQNFEIRVQFDTEKADVDLAGTYLNAYKAR